MCDTQIQFEILKLTANAYNTATGTFLSERLAVTRGDRKCRYPVGTEEEAGQAIVMAENSTVTVTTER